MSRAIHRLLVTAAVGGFAILPSLAFAADASPGGQPQVPTTITVSPPQHDPAGGEIPLTARVAPDDGESATGRTRAADGGKGGSGESGGKKGKGHKKKSSGHPKRHIVETGTVTFTVDGKAQPAIKVMRDHATEKIQLTPGTHTVSAGYSGDDNYRASTSTPVTFTVS